MVVVVNATVTVAGTGSVGKFLWMPRVRLSGMFRSRNRIPRIPRCHTLAGIDLWAGTNGFGRVCKGYYSRMLCNQTLKYLSTLDGTYMYVSLYVHT